VYGEAAPDLSMFQWRVRQNKGDDIGGAAIHENCRMCYTCNTSHMPGWWADKWWLPHNKRWILLLSISKGRFIFAHIGQQSPAGQELLITGASWSQAVKTHRNAAQPLSMSDRPNRDLYYIQTSASHVGFEPTIPAMATDPCLKTAVTGIRSVKAA